MIKKGELYWIVNQRKGEITIGKKGVNEFVLNMDELALRTDVPNNMSMETMYEFAKKESQYVEFEEVVEKAEIIPSEERIEINFPIALKAGMTFRVSTEGVFPLTLANT